jgi:hypothetical protein
MAWNATLVPINAYAVTPSNTTILNAFYLYVGGTGNVAVLPFAQVGQPTPVSVVFHNAPAGSYIWVQCSKVLSTGTTATNIIAMGPK